jgi:hypothetical protein
MDYLYGISPGAVSPWLFLVVALLVVIGVALLLKLLVVR